MRRTFLLAIASLAVALATPAHALPTPEVQVALQQPLPTADVPPPTTPCVNIERHNNGRFSSYEATAGWSPSVYCEGGYTEAFSTGVYAACDPAYYGAACPVHDAVWDALIAVNDLLLGRPPNQ